MASKFKAKQTSTGRPACVAEETWAIWEAYWDRLDARAKSEQQRKNRMSEVEGPGTRCSQHTGESRSAIEHYHKLVHLMLLLGAPNVITRSTNIEPQSLLWTYYLNDDLEIPGKTLHFTERRIANLISVRVEDDFRMNRMEPLDTVDDEEFEEGFEDAHSTDEEIDNLYDATEIVKKRMAHDEYFNMDDKKWDDMISEAIAHGHLKDTKECEEILEDMLQWDKLLPDEIKEKVAKRLDEISDMVEKGELEAEEGYALFKEFEDQMVLECGKLMEKEPLEFDESIIPDKKKDVDDPPGEGPILRWQTRVVFAPGGDAWHPKNRKVKLAVTVKELGLSKHQFRRLRELVGKRYHPGRDELTITSERFEDREENRKDCLRTLLSLIEEAGKANKIVEDARTAYAKQRLKANPKFMASAARYNEFSRVIRVRVH
nr:uncharacterized protein LOC109188018 [Ipomoea batatas]